VYKRQSIGNRFCRKQNVFHIIGGFGMELFKTSSRKRIMQAEIYGFLLYLKKRSIINRRSKVYAFDFVGHNVAPATSNLIKKNKVEILRKTA
jgi:hypothetical protein